MEVHVLTAHLVDLKWYLKYLWMQVHVLTAYVVELNGYLKYI